MISAPWSLRATCRALAAGWNAFFHAPSDARVCAAIRMAFATVVLLDLSILYPDLDYWFTDGGVLPTELSRQIASPYAWSVFWHLPSTSEVVHACYWIIVVQAVLLLLGVLPNLQVLCLFVWLTSLENRNVLIIDGEDVVIRLLSLILIFMPLGRCWSVDAAVRKWWAGARGGKKGSGVDCGNRLPSPMTAPQSTPDPLGVERAFAAPGWGLRLLQIQMCVALFSAGMWKLNGEAWLDGTALYYVARLDDYFDRLPTPTWLFDTPWAVAIMTWSVIVVELLAPILLWFKETRRLALAAIVLFHLANEWTMHLFLFHWVMLCGWMSFLSPDDFAWVGRLLRKGPRA
jgi:hypothetical protein